MGELVIWVCVEAYMIQMVILGFIIYMQQAYPDKSKTTDIIKTKKDLLLWVIPYYIILKSIFNTISEFINSLDD